MQITHPLISLIAALACTGGANAQNTTIPATAINITNPALQNWNATRGGNQGIWFCPEPSFKNGTRVTTDICSWVITSNGQPKCGKIPAYANNANGSKPHISVIVTKNNYCLFFPNNNCQRQKNVRNWYVGTLKEGKMQYSDLYATMGGKDETMGRSYACSVKGYDHANVYGALKPV